VFSSFSAAPKKNGPSMRYTSTPRGRRTPESGGSADVAASPPV
jgi:hypothetical protein